MSQTVCLLHRPCTAVERDGREQRVRGRAGFLTNGGSRIGQRPGRAERAGRDDADWCVGPFICQGEG